MTDDDAGLMKLASQGDMRAFGSLVERNQKAVYNFFLRMTGSVEDAEDLTQRLFINLYRSAGRYRPKASFRTYLYRIASNLAISFARESKHKVTQSLERIIEDGYQPAVAPGAAGPESHVEEIELRRAYAAVLLGFPPDWRTAIELRVGKGLSYREIAVVMGKSVSSVESLIFRARERLAQELREFREKKAGD